MHESGYETKIQRTTLRAVPPTVLIMDILYPVMIQADVKKHYAGVITVQEGVILPKPDVDIKGGQLRGSKVPKVALKFAEDFSGDLAMQIYNLQMIFDPEVFAIGGGISAQKILFDILDQCFEEIREGYGTLFFSKPEVVACAYRNDANLIGALYRFVSEKSTLIESEVE